MAIQLNCTNPSSEKLISFAYWGRYVRLVRFFPTAQLGEYSGGSQRSTFLSILDPTTNYCVAKPGQKDHPKATCKCILWKEYHTLEVSKKITENPTTYAVRKIYGNKDFRWAAIWEILLCLQKPEKWNWSRACAAFVFDIQDTGIWVPIAKQSGVEGIQKIWNSRLIWKTGIKNNILTNKLFTIIFYR